MPYGDLAESAGERGQSGAIGAGYPRRSIVSWGGFLDGRGRFIDNAHHLMLTNRVGLQSRPDVRRSSCRESIIIPLGTGIRVIDA